MKKADLGYLGGVMDGEGCITILEMKNRFNGLIYRYKKRA